MSDPIRRLIDQTNAATKGKGRALEEAEQVTVADWLRLHRILFHHSPNGGMRDAKVVNGKRVSITAIKMKRMGTSNGFPDLLILDRPPRFPESPGAAIEMKKSDSGKGKEDRGASGEQKEWLASLQARGWQTAICHGAGPAIAFLESLGYGSRR